MISASQWPVDKSLRNYQWTELRAADLRFTPSEAAEFLTDYFTAYPAVRARLLSLGGIYIAVVFLTYLALGVGLLKTLNFFTRQHLPARFGALAAILFGLWMLKDFFLPDVGRKLQAPGQVGTVPRSGAVYLGALSLLALQPSVMLGYGYLVLYNLIFVLPLVIILIAASARPTFNRLAHWNLHHKEWVLLALGGGVVAIGF